MSLSTKVLLLFYMQNTKKNDFPPPAKSFSAKTLLKNMCVIEYLSMGNETNEGRNQNGIK